MRKYWFILLLFFTYNPVKGQFVSHISDEKTYEAIPAEKIYVHYNTSLLFSGDYLYFKVYCIQEPTQRLSNLSKIGYVMLINEKKEKVFSQKIYLENGEGSGDFFIETNVPSGKYKLISYTNWMQNNTEMNYFQADVCIINPFQENQSVFTSKSSENKPDIQKIKYTDYQDQKGVLNLKTDKKQYGKREKVSVDITAITDTLAFGRYSISVRKVLPMNTSSIISSAEISSLKTKKNDLGKTENQIVFLPEMRGELIYGKIVNKANNKAVTDIPVAFSIPGEDFVFKVARTNQEGVFYLNIENKYAQNQAVIEIMNSSKDSLKVVFEPVTNISMGALTFADFSISAIDKEVILQQSVFNQIENAYSSVRTDSSISYKQNPEFFGKNLTTYQLDDYTRFSTIKETIVEIVTKANINQEKGKSYINVKVYDDNLGTGLLPLVLVDGVFISNHERLLGYNARRIKSISVLDEKYLYGGEVFKGLILFETLEGAYVKEMIGGNEKFDLFKPSQQKKYYSQKYTDQDTYLRIPDFRSQLFWDPRVLIRKKNTAISFYTSDNKGDFEICLEGFTNSGRPISIRESIKVD